MGQNGSGSNIPPLRSDGYLPDGVHRASESEVMFRFGTSSDRRRRLALRLRRWIDLSRLVHAKRFLLDGSFVTGKTDPGDVDAVVLLPADFERQLSQGIEAAMILEDMLLFRQPEEIFAAEDEDDWNEWVAFFAQTRELDGRRKGLVELIL